VSPGIILREAAPYTSLRLGTVEYEIRPAESEELAEAHAGEDGDDIKRLEAILWLIGDF
jgi:predicted transcriptional regulator